MCLLVTPPAGQRVAHPRTLKQEDDFASRPDASSIFLMYFFVILATLILIYFYKCVPLPTRVDKGATLIRRVGKGGSKSLPGG